MVEHRATVRRVGDTGVEPQSCSTARAFVFSRSDGMSSLGVDSTVPTRTVMNSITPHLGQAAATRCRPIGTSTHHALSPTSDNIAQETRAHHRSRTFRKVLRAEELSLRPAVSGIDPSRIDPLPPASSSTFSIASCPLIPCATR